MDVIEQVAGSVTILEPRGRIDSVSAKEFGECFSKHLNAGHNQLVIDLHSITYISSAGFRQLLIAKRSTQDKNGKLALCGISGEVRRLFDIGAFGELLPIYPTREAGIAGVQ
jgi:anti-anti-sigma factor